MKKIVAYVFPVLLLVPVVALAQNFTYVNNWLNQALYWFRLAITVVMILMTLFFLVTIFRYISAKDEGEQKKERAKMVQGLIGLFVAVGVWGILRIAGGVLGIDTTNPNSAAPMGVTCPPGLVYKSTSGTCERL